MKIAIAAMLVGTGAAVGVEALAQEPKAITREASQELFSQMKEPCGGGGPPKKACGVLVYAPVDCSQSQDPHLRQVFNSYEDGTVRFQTGNGVQRGRPGLLLSGFSMIDAKGHATRYADPVFVSLADFEGGKTIVKVCGKMARISSDAFLIPDAIKRYFKNNP